MNSLRTPIQPQAYQCFQFQISYPYSFNCTFKSQFIRLKKIFIFKIRLMTFCKNQVLCCIFYNNFVHPQNHENILNRQFELQSLSFSIVKAPICEVYLQCLILCGKSCRCVSLMTKLEGVYMKFTWSIRPHALD